MKKEELRIGNVIKHKLADSVFVIVKGVHTPLYYESPTGTIDGDVFQNFAPIPLTEDWLQRLGFKKNERNRWQKPSHNYAIFWFTYTATGDDHRMWRIEYHNKNYGKDEYQDCHQWVDRLEYVHQLQNLYFALTGYELSVGTK